MRGMTMQASLPTLARECVQSRGQQSSAPIVAVAGILTVSVAVYVTEVRSEGFFRPASSPN